MAPVRGLPFLDYLLSWLQREGIQEVILCVGYKRSRIEKFVGGGRKWELQVKYSIEKQPLGTGGAVKKAQRLISGERLFVVNGDTFVDVRLKELMEFHKSRKATATLAAVKVVDSGRYGWLRLDGKGRITAFLEKSGREGSKGSETEKCLINGGVYLFEKKLLKTIRAVGPVSLEREVFPLQIAKKGVYGFELDAYFLDIGLPEDLGRAQSELPERIRVNHSR